MIRAKKIKIKKVFKVILVCYTYAFKFMKLHVLFVSAAIFCLSVVRNSEIRVFFFPKLVIGFDYVINCVVGF